MFAEGFEQTWDAISGNNGFPFLLQFRKFNHQNDPGCIGLVLASGPVGPNGGSNAGWEIGCMKSGGRGCGTVMEILPTKYIWIPYLMNLIQMEEMCCLVMFGWSVHSRREKRVVSCNVAAPPKLFLQAQKTYVQSKNCMNMKVPHGRTYKANFLANELYWITYNNQCMFSH